MIKRTEAMIQKAVLEFLAMVPKCYAFRAGSGALKTENGNYVKTGRPGVPDIVVCFDGKWIGLEIKTDTGRQSQSQKQAEKKILDSGGQYYIIRSISDVRKIIF